MPKATTKTSKVFISHGHNETLKLKLRNFVKERLRIEPVILAEQPDLGLTIVEKLERYGSECDFALIVLTADDQTVSGGARARQNVLHELGFFHGILGRDRVLLLKQSGVELFSNISGLIYKEFEGDNIEDVFEAIRTALESCSAQRGGQTVRKKTNRQQGARDAAPEPPMDAGRLIEAATKSAASKMADRLCSEIEEIVRTRPDRDAALRFIRRHLQAEIEDTEEGIGSCEKSKQDSMTPKTKDPNGALGSAFGIMAFGRIVADLRMKKRALQAMLGELESLSKGHESPQQIVDALSQLARFYLK